MVRGVMKHVQPMLASFANSFVSGQGVAQYAAPAVAAVKPSGIFGGGKRITVPLDEPLPGVHSSQPATPQAPQLQVRSPAGAVSTAETTAQDSIMAFERQSGLLQLFCNHLNTE